MCKTVQYTKNCRLVASMFLRCKKNLRSGISRLLYRHATDISRFFLNMSRLMLLVCAVQIIRNKPKMVNAPEGLNQVF